MASHVTSLLADVERERRALNQVSGLQLQSAAARSSLRQLVEKYFNEVKPQLVHSPGAEVHIAAVDAAMQELLTLCHRKGAVGKYKTALRTIKQNLVQLDSRLVTAPVQSAASERSSVDHRILVTLKALLPSAALSYEQALLDLASPERLSWRGPAADLREALRETLDHLAPDDQVTALPGYRQEEGARGPTMKQKVRFILRSRNAPKATASTTEDATVAIDESVGSFVRSVYTRSSVSTHTPTDKDEVLRVLDLVRVVLAELLEARG